MLHSYTLDTASPSSFNLLVHTQSQILLIQGASFWLVPFVLLRVDAEVCGGSIMCVVVNKHIYRNVNFTITVTIITIYGPMIYTAPRIRILMRADG